MSLETNNFQVLYVEDNEVVRLLTHKMLEEHFTFIDISNDGVEAFDKYMEFYEKHSRYYDIVITDIEMPNMDGKELSKKILEINPEQSIMVFSAHNESEQLEELIQIGITSYLHKPIDKEEFSKVINKTVTQVQEQYSNQSKNDEISRLNHELDKLEKHNDSFVITSKTDLNGVITYASQAFEDISGYRKEELIGHHHNLVRHPDMPSEVFENLWTTIKSQKLWSGEIKNIRRDGSYYWVKAYIAPYYDQNNNHIGYSAIRTDITAQKKLEHLNKKLELILNNSKDGIICFDKSLRVSKDYSKICLYILNQRENIVGKKISDLLFEFDITKKEMFDSAFEEFFTDVDKSRRELLVSLLPNKHKIGDIEFSIKYNMVDEEEFMLFLTIIE
jgi:PAS domain S-box-containing protein